ncbi:MFS transporter [Kitasatospora sp. GP82]|uniref:MFS transporter n=1 Tax=Kitasatospora sp. GP82 TaxID=3035089 RepID=UPI00247531C0|nr:MFS transporter [Kitasatospora sp. GP82]MDH6126869.1 putative MFS family arabinose efflux permease [Kitasatospora sp. GP82]
MTLTATAPAPVGPAASALRNGSFRRYLTGQSLSQLGDQVWYVALSWSAVHLGSAGTAGLLLTLSALPRLLLLLFGGVLADRYDIRRLMIGSDLLRVVVTLAAAGAVLLTPGIAVLAALAVTFGIVDALFLPAAGAMQPRLLRPEQYDSGAVVANMAARLALSLGAPLGGLIVAWGGLSLALAVDAATFALSAATLATVRPRPLAAAPDATAPDAAAAQPKPRDSFGQDFRAGFAFLLRHRVLGPLTLAVLLTNLGFVGPMNIGMAELSAHRGWGASGIGLMLTGFGLGAAAGALLMARVRAGGHPAWWIALCATVQGAALLGTALAPDVATAAALTGMAGVCSGPIAVLASVLTQRHTPDGLRGRVASFNALLSFGVVPVASAATGFLIAAVGLDRTYTLCAAIEAAGLLLLLAPGFRRARIEH